LKLLLQSFTVAPKATEEERRGIFTLGDFMFLHGHLNLSGLPYFPDVLRASNLHITSTDTPAVKGQLVSLEGKGPHGYVSVSFDSALGHWPRKVEWRLNADHVIEGKKLSELGLQQVELIVDDVEFERIGNHSLPSRFTVLTTAISASRTRIIRSVCEFRDFSLAPRHLLEPRIFELSDQVPEGTKVQINNEQQLHYSWRDGRVTKEVGIEPGRLKDHAFSSGGVPIALVVVAVGAALALFALLMVVKRRRLINEP
jgi:hypothetical protein